MAYVRTKYGLVNLDMATRIETAHDHGNFYGVLAYFAAGYQFDMHQVTESAPLASELTEAEADAFIDYLAAGLSRFAPLQNAADLVHSVQQNLGSRCPCDLSDPQPVKPGFTLCPECLDTAQASGQSPELWRNNSETRRKAGAA